MSKSDETKQRIIKASVRLFADKGYSPVTMKDICEATGLSRGGLYRYYKSTAEIMEAILESEQKGADEVAACIYELKWTAMEMLDGFLSSQKRFIESDVVSIETAAMQFSQLEAGRQTNIKRFSRTVLRLADLIRQGQAEGVFAKGNADIIAAHVILVIGGLRQQCALIGFNQTFIDKQFELIRNIIVQGFEEE